MHADRRSNSQAAGSRSKRMVSSVSAVLDDGRIVEAIYDPSARATAFIVATDGAWEQLAKIDLPDGRRLVPPSPENNLLTHSVLLLPSAPEAYGTKFDLLARLQQFIHRYVDLPPTFERIAAHYVVLSWLYDALHEVPYLRVMGEPGSGKTRFLLTVGSLCYKPIFASAASTVAPLFRMLDTIRGTLILDEADFRVSDERADVVKILNNGTCRGFPVLRAEANPQTKEFNPTAFHVFGPKLVGTRGPFDDRALETRFISERMGAQRLRADVPIGLSDGHAQEALRLRNQLLRFRLEHRGAGITASAPDPTIQPRLNQVFGPLLAMVDDAATRHEIARLAHGYHRQSVSDRGLEAEGLVLEVIRDLRAKGEPLALKDLAEEFASRHGSDASLPVTPRWIGQLLRRRLGISTVRQRDGYVVGASEGPRLTALFEQFGLNDPDQTPATAGSPSSQVHEASGNAG